MASEQDINKRLRSLHQDFDFLLDNNVISADLYDQLVERIPRRWKRSDSVTAAVPAPAPTTSSPPPASVNTLATQMDAASISTAPHEKTPPAPEPVHEPPPAYGLAQAEALYDYHSNDEGDLPISAGQRITILEYVNNDWWRGEVNGRQGIFPSNYVRKIEAPNQDKDKALFPPPTQYGGYPGVQQQYQPPPQQQPMYGAPAPYQAPPPQQQPEQKKPSRLGEFGKNYGKTFVNATAWGGGMTLGADVINKIF